MGKIGVGDGDGDETEVGGGTEVKMRCFVEAQRPAAVKKFRRGDRHCSLGYGVSGLLCID